ncbi:hypothetical protein MILUP08_42130 [Micromonospora lupini str. Lupac 08]|uniref:Uncharacterized protein n=1 Tax=Micromonospora lupini str. Lupac 08 TaxID=1150864 RepID=I0L063_9ACTN|nr:hypothetical protein MILUP08_42130 [Micromonospora lupini str. Lupac 08]
MVSPETLGLSAELAAGLRAWSDWKDQHSEYGGGRVATDEQHRARSEQGRTLSRQLAEETAAEGPVRCATPTGARGRVGGLDLGHFPFLTNGKCPRSATD